MDDGTAALFHHLNRGKRCRTLDLSSEEARVELDRLIAATDVVLVHMDPVEAEAVDIDWRDIAAKNTTLVVCEIKDLGHGDAFAEQAGSELTLQAMSGFTRYVGEPGGAPCRVGFEIAGSATAAHAFQAIAAALLHRQQSGEGQYVSVSGLGSLLSMKTILLAAQSGGTDAWAGFHLNGPHWAPDTGWDTNDGQVTFDFRYGQDREWAAFCQAVGLERLIGHPDYADWKSTLHIGDRRFVHGEPYRQVLARMTSHEATSLVNGLDGACMKFNDYEEVLDDPQVRTLDVVVTVADAPPGARQQLAVPFHFAGEAKAAEAAQ